MSLYGVKITKYDRTFSELIMLRDDRRCQRCGNVSTEDRAKKMDTSHIFPRGNKAVRCDPDNACCKCASCHDWWHANPILANQWLLSVIGEEAYSRLCYKARQPFKQTVYLQDLTRRDQNEQIALIKAGTLVIPCFNPIFRPLQRKVKA